MIGNGQFNYYMSESLNLYKAGMKSVSPKEYGAFKSQQRKKAKKGKRK